MKKSLIIFLFILCFGIVSAQIKRTFLHPGAMNGQQDLDLVKAKIAAGEQPWLGAFNQVKTKAKGGTNALKTINSNNNDANISKNDAIKTYANALVWYYTDQEVYAQQAIALLNAWTILEGFNAGSDQDKLQAGWIGALFGPAAEIMREYAGWKHEDMEKVQAMFRRAYYPQLKTVSTWNGNVDLTQIDALLNIAVFCEDEAEFNLGIERLRKRNPAYFYMETDAAGSRNYGGSNFTGSWYSPKLLIEGLTQETCRDNNHHAQYAMASALHAAEVAWNQGVDVYTENTERYTAVMELMATQTLTGTMQGTCADNVTTKDLLDTWEVGYNHYHNRKGLSLPNTERLLKEKVRSQGWSDWNVFHETLTHGEISPFIPPLSYLSSVIDTNASVITVKFTNKLILPENPVGFEVIANDIEMLGITSIKMNSTDSGIIHIYLNKDVLFSDVISISYSGTDILAQDSTILNPFTDKLVEIRLPGAENYITVQVKSKKLGLPVESCSVSFNNKTEITNSNGEAFFREFNGEYILVAEKKHLEPLKNKSFTIESDTILTVLLDSTLYNVTFQVEDSLSGNILSNVTITFGSQLKNTDFFGLTSFSLPAGLRAVDYKKTNFQSISSELQIESDTIIVASLLQTHAKVKFRLKNDLVTVNNALVILANDSLFTNQVGTCTFGSVLIGSTSNYRAEKENYFPVPGTLTVNADTTIDLQLAKSVANIEFLVSADSGIIRNAIVILNKDSLLLSKEGQAKFYNIPINQNYLVQIFGDNTYDYSNSFWLANDTTIQATLITTGTEQLVLSGDFKVYPNPANAHLTIESSKSNIDMIEMYDIRGTRIIFREFESAQHLVKLDLNCSPGIYLLKITSGNNIKSLKVIVK
ncbi:MAG: T9SS type A sorting domain-containing protein [Chitinophagaceae bacterium]|nr:T9SS type A sorting domain-containing protein [Chitinophagaceae bacterium]